MQPPGAARAYGRYAASLQPSPHGPALADALSSGGLSADADFHSLRRAFITAMERAEVPESTAKLIAGHARGSLTFGLYSRGVPVAQLAQAVQRVDYGAHMATAVAAL